jgi:hypothetical protein
MRRSFSLLMMAATLMAIAIPAHADVHLDGRWKQSALTETFTIQQWLDAGCGPAPQSTSTGGGEIINIRMEGDELAFVGGGRVYRTNQCYDPMPTLTRESHSRASDGKQWRTRCVTPPADPRKTVLNTLVNAPTESHIDLVETGRYEITLENGRCMADVRRTRSFDLVRDENPTQPTATPTTTTAPPKPTNVEPPRPPPASCGTPGAPSKLEVRPSKKLLRTGESFKFRAIVLDAQGCDTRTATTWKVAPSESGEPIKGVTVDGTGNVTVAADATEGNVEIIAIAAGKDARVGLEIASPARYDELLARSGLNAAGENDEASTATIASTSIGAGEGRVEDRSRERRYLFLGIIGGVLLVLGLMTIILLRRARRAKELLAQADERHDERVRQVLDRRRRREEEHAAQMRAHEESLAAARAAHESRPKSKIDPSKTMPLTASPAAAAAAPAVTAKIEPMVCPTCHKESPPGTTFCPNDGTALVSASKGALLAYPPMQAIAQRGSASGAPPSRGKICPTCGDRFEGGADYCGKDGTQLVLLN